MAWAVVKTLPQSEVKVCRFFKARGIVCYLPKVLLLDSWVRHQHPVKVLFPGYLFFCICSQWRDVFESPDILYPLMSGEALSPLPDPVVDEIRSRESVDGLIHVNERSGRRGFRRGQRIKVNVGPFLDREGRFVFYVGKELIAARFPLLGRQILVKIRADDVSTVSS